MKHALWGMLLLAMATNASAERTRWRAQVGGKPGDRIRPFTAEKVQRRGRRAEVVKRVEGTLDVNTGRLTLSD